jgi:hypothetical protein
MFAYALQIIIISILALFALACILICLGIRNRKK